MALLRSGGDILKCIKEGGIGSLTLTYPFHYVGIGVIKFFRLGYGVKLFL